MPKWELPSDIVPIFPRPSSWAPEMTFEIHDGKFMISVGVRDYGLNCRLGFAATGKSREDGDCVRNLFELMWQTRELARLGRTDQLRSLGALK